LKLPNAPWSASDFEVRQARQLSWLWEEIARVINGNLSLGNPTDGPDNIDGAWATTTTPGVADTEFALTHNLQRVPIGWLTVSIDKAAIIYDGGTAWTTAVINLKSNVATVALTIFVF
jgi:hypothetical protein